MMAPKYCYSSSPARVKKRGDSSNSNRSSVVQHQQERAVNRDNMRDCLARLLLYCYRLLPNRPIDIEIK